MCDLSLVKLNKSGKPDGSLGAFDEAMKAINDLMIREKLSPRDIEDEEQEEWEN